MAKIWLKISHCLLKIFKISAKFMSTKFKEIKNSKKMEMEMEMEIKKFKILMRSMSNG